MSKTVQDVRSLVGKSADRLILCNSILIVMLFFLPLATAELTRYISISTSGTIAYVSGQPLHVEGRWIKDDLGNIVLLRGVNKGGYNNYPAGNWQAEGEGAFGGAQVFRESAVHYQMGVLRDNWGVNCMRWTITCQWWIENTGNYRYNIRRAIEIAGEYGIYIIFAPWRIAEGVGHGDPFTQGWTHDTFYNFWLSVSQELGDLPNVIYDLWNEPITPVAEWQLVVQEIVNRIRGTGDNSIILYQHGYGTGVNKRIVNWYNQYPLTNPSNVVISTHLYLSGYGYSSEYNTLKSQMETSQIKLVSEPVANGGLNMPLLIGEVGGLDTPTELKFFTNVLTILNEWEYGYIGWILFPQVSYALIQNQPYFPPPTAAGQILIDAIAGRL